MITEDALKNIIDEALESRSTIDVNRHTEHHEFIQEFIEESKLKRERWESIKRQVFGWGIIAIIASAGSVVAKKFGVSL